MTQLDVRPGTDSSELDPQAVVTDWLAALHRAARTQDLAGIRALLAADPWWRDIYALSWDLVAANGADDYYGEDGPPVETADLLASVSPLALVWNIDDRGELRTTLRHSGHQRLRFMATGLRLARFFSGHVALMIKAMNEGILDPQVNVEKKKDQIDDGSASS